MLQQIGEELSLADVIDNDTFPQEEIRQLLEEFLSIDGISVAFATKIIHKKRPNLIPIIDKQHVMEIYGFPLNNANNAQEVVKWIKHIGKDIRNNRGRLEQLKNIAEEEVRDVYPGLNISFSLIRLFDIILWQHQ